MVKICYNFIKINFVKNDFNKIYFNKPILAAKKVAVMKGAEKEHEAFYRTGR